MQNPITPLKNNSTFRFTCSPQVPCFNACCRDLNQVLTPYDVLRLKQYLDMSSGEFLHRYTEESTGPETGFPVVSLRFGDSNQRTCPFVTNSGCRVYPARPSSCRTYPLARGVSRNRETGKQTEHWALIREPHCLGFIDGGQQTVSEWVADQQITSYNQINDKMLELISLKNRLFSGVLLPVHKEKVYRSLYDIDAFRAELFSPNYKTTILFDTKTLDRDRNNDEDLLVIAMDWVKAYLRTIAARQSK